MYARASRQTISDAVSQNKLCDFVRFSAPSRRSLKWRTRVEQLPFVGESLYQHFTGRPAYSQYARPTVYQCASVDQSRGVVCRRVIARIIRLMPVARPVRL